MNDNSFSAKIKEILTSRLFYITICFVALVLVLIFRLYSLQIVKGVEKTEKKEYYTQKERSIPATRGNIYDCNGELLAYNALSYSVYLEQSASLNTNAKLNDMILLMYRILNSHGYEPSIDFSIKQDESGELVFTVTGNAELRFKKNAYGLRSVNYLSEQQKNASAAEVFDFLCNGDKKSPMFQIDPNLSTEDKLKICTVRYLYFSDSSNSTRYTLVTNVDDVTIAALMESSEDLPGITIEQVTKRVYNYSTYFAHIMGYTGQITTSELEKLNADGPEKYTSTDQIGKTGVEAAYEDRLSGTKGVELVTLNNKGKIVSKKIISEPVPGENIYLTLDAKLQESYYKLLEKNIADVLVKYIVSSLDYGTKGESSNNIKIPVYEVYYALFNNSVIDIKRLEKPEATSIEKRVYSLYDDYKYNILYELEDYVAYGNKALSSSLSSPCQKYLDLLYTEIKNLKYIDVNKIDTNDSYYKEYNYGHLSFYEYIEHCINAEWVNLPELGISGTYNTTKEIYERMMVKALDSLYDNRDFDMMVYHDLIFSYKLSGREICLLLFDQNVLEYNQDDYTNLYDNKVSAYTFIKKKIQNTEITPAQLALEPYNGAVVQTNCKTGEFLAIVTYPSYDNNKLANKIDWDYYSALLNDNSTPLYNRATQMRTPTGSTIKPMVAVSGLLNGVITSSEKIHDDIHFLKIDPSPSCWLSYGHGDQNMQNAIKNSCNYYFYEVGYRLAMKNLEKYSDTQGITLLADTGKLFGFDQNTGIEISEALPSFSTSDAVRSSIGYGHKFTPTQLSRYATTIATNGTLYKLTILKKITDWNGNIVYTNSPVVTNVIDNLSENDWKYIHKGMEQVITSNATLKKLYGTLPVTVAAKTGTAEVSANNAPHALTVSFAPSINPETSVISIITNGYSGTNAAILCGYVYQSYYKITEQTELGEIEYVND